MRVGLFSLFGKKGLSQAIVIALLLLAPKTFANNQPESISIGVYEYAPFSFQDQTGQFRGYYIELIEVAAQRLAKRLQYVACPLARCLELVRKGDIDLVAGLLKTEQRMKSLQYVFPAIDLTLNEYQFYTKSTKPSIHHYNDLYDKVIGVQRGSVYFSLFNNDKKLVKVELLNNALMLDMLLKERIDVFINSGHDIDNLLAESPNYQSVVKSPFTIKDASRGYIVTTQSDRGDALASSFTPILYGLFSDGTAKAIADKYRIEQNFDLLKLQAIP